MWQGLKTEGAKRHRLQPENASKKQKNRRKNFPLEWNAIWPQDTWKGSQLLRFVSLWQASKVTTFYWTEYMKRMSDRIVSKFSKPELKGNWGADQVVQNKTKWMCVLFLQGVACGYKKDRIHSGLLVFAKSRMIFQNITLVQKWPLNSKKECSELCIADGLSYDHERRLLDCRPHQFPSSIYECSFQKMRVQIVETKPTDFQLLWSHIRNKRWWSSLRIAVVNFMLAHLQLCHRQSNHKLVVFPAGCKKGYSFCTHIGVAFSVPLVATSSFVEKLQTQLTCT